MLVDQSLLVNIAALRRVPLPSDPSRAHAGRADEATARPCICRLERSDSPPDPAAARRQGAARVGARNSLRHLAARRFAAYSGSVRAGLVQQERTGRISRCSLDVGPLLDAAAWLNRYTKYWQRSSMYSRRGLRRSTCGPPPKPCAAKRAHALTGANENNQGAFICLIIRSYRGNNGLRLAAGYSRSEVTRCGAGFGCRV
jgi:hypothetical protein